MHIYTYIVTQMYMHIFVQNVPHWYSNILSIQFRCTHIFICIHIFTHMYVCIYTFSASHVGILIYCRYNLNVYKYSYIYIYSDTYVYAYIHLVRPTLIFYHDVCTKYMNIHIQIYYITQINVYTYI